MEDSLPTEQTSIKQHSYKCYLWIIASVIIVSISCFMILRNLNVSRHLEWDIMHSDVPITDDIRLRYRILMLNAHKWLVIITLANMLTSISILRNRWCGRTFAIIVFVLSFFVFFITLTSGH